MTTRAQIDAEALTNVACLAVGLFLIGQHLGQLTMIAPLLQDHQGQLFPQENVFGQIGGLTAPILFGVLLIVARGFVARWAFPEKSASAPSRPIVVTERLIVLAAGLFILAGAVPSLAFELYVYSTGGSSGLVSPMLAVVRFILGIVLVFGASRIGDWVDILRSPKPNLD